ncbi:Putative mitochondrial transcription termination factor mterf [Trichuris trichiura]|uniref:Putative mitochondrial transcription termination factor mterf n=1 Tax=Trichuris trichiura TaxID=36087 RepID=A0A077Z1D5_TRITR|nr:Putative mitochondrial transcription termination factor mterf [Trichuris trichiura]
MPQAVLTSLESGLQEVTPTDVADPLPSVSDTSVEGKLTVSRDAGRISKYKSKLFLKSYTLAPYVNDSEVLRNLVDFGVDLATLETRGNVADFLVKLNWEKDVKPRLQFLFSLGVPVDYIGSYLTKNPWFFQQSMDSLRSRIEYLKSKNFPDASITRIIMKARYWLNFEVQSIDARLGWYQKQFKLSGDEVRQIVTENPKLITFGTGYTQTLQFMFKEELGFSADQAKQLLVKDPKLWTTYKSILSNSFNYLHNVIGFSHETILSWPRCLREKKQKIEARHKWLKLFKRDQFDRTKPNFVSIEAMLNGSDETFCSNVAKCSLRAYEEFLKRQ